MKKQIIIFITAMVLVFAMACGATFAYLWSMAGDVTNTFVSGGFGKIYLQEVDDDGDKDINWFTGTDTDYEKSYTIVPGVDIEKDPQVKFTFESDAVSNAYIFVKIEFPTGATLKDTNNCWHYDENSSALNTPITGKINGKEALTITMGDNWKKINASADGAVVFTYCAPQGAIQSISKASNPLASGLSLFKAIDANGKTIEVSDALTEADLQVFATKMANYDLSFSAYAIQTDGFIGEVAKAWTKVSAMN